MTTTQLQHLLTLQFKFRDQSAVVPNSRILATFCLSKPKQTQVCRCKKAAPKLPRIAFNFTYQSAVVLTPGLTAINCLRGQRCRTCLGHTVQLQKHQALQPVPGPRVQCRTWAFSVVQYFTTRANMQDMPRPQPSSETVRTSCIWLLCYRATMILTQIISEASASHDADTWDFFQNPNPKAPNSFCPPLQQPSRVQLRVEYVQTLSDNLPVKSLCSWGP